MEDEDAGGETGGEVAKELDEADEVDASSESEMSVDEEYHPTVTTQELLKDMERKMKKGVIKNKAVTANRPTKKKEVPQPMSKYAAKFAVSLPLGDVIDMKPNLHGLLSNLVTESAYR